MKVRATSYAMGRPLATVDFEVANLRAAVRHRKLSGLPVGGQGNAGRKVRVVGIRRLEES